MINRRGFFRLTAGALIAASAPALAHTAPVIYADGENCDASGIEALIRGDVVRFARPELAARITSFDGDDGRVIDFDMIKMKTYRTIFIDARKARYIISRLHCVCDNLDVGIHVLTNPEWQE